MGVLGAGRPLEPRTQCHVGGKYRKLLELSRTIGFCLVPRGISKIGWVPVWHEFTHFKLGNAALELRNDTKTS